MDQSKPRSSALKRPLSNDADDDSANGSAKRPVCDIEFTDTVAKIIGDRIADRFLLHMNHLGDKIAGIMGDRIISSQKEYLEKKKSANIVDDLADTVANKVVDRITCDSEFANKVADKVAEKIRVPWRTFD